MKLRISAAQLSVRTERLVIRPYRKSDYAAWLEGRQGVLAKQNRFDRGPRPKSLLTRKTFLDWHQDKESLRKKDMQYVFGIFDRKTGANLGVVDLFIITRQVIQAANLGYEIHNQYWGKGYAKEAVRAVLDLAYRRLKLHRVEAGLDLDNLASRSVAEGVGMRYEGVRKKYFFDGKKWQDTQYFVMTAEDWGVRGMKPSVRVGIGG